jgi:hypothetical protein
VNDAEPIKLLSILRTSGVISAADLIKLDDIINRNFLSHNIFYCFSSMVYANEYLPHVAQEDATINSWIANFIAILRNKINFNTMKYS